MTLRRQTNESWNKQFEVFGMQIERFFFCVGDCMAGDHYCMNSDFTGPCTTGDMDCRCKAGFGLKALTTATSKCVPVRCTLEDPNCYCNNTFDPIDECFCGYWTTPDQNNPGFCTSKFKTRGIYNKIVSSCAIRQQYRKLFIERAPI